MKAQTSAERQARFRERRRDTHRRINKLVTNETHFNLGVLARSYGITETAILELLITESIKTS